MNLRIDPADYALLDALLAQALRQTERACRLRGLQRRMNRAALRQREKKQA